MTVQFVATLPDGRQVAGAIDVPGAVPPGPYRAAAAARLQTTMDKMLRDRHQSGASIRQRRDAVIPVLAAQLEAELPPAAPARSEIERDAEGRTVRSVAYRATPPPNISAREIARQLAPYVVGEQLLAEMAAADRSRQQEQAANITRRLVKAADDVMDRQRSGPNIPGTSP